jgi:hypothetical protein
MAGKLPVPSEVDPQHIARPNVEQTSAEEQKALAEVRRKIREQKEREILELEEEAMKQYISHFSMNRQGNVKKDKDVVINIPTLKVQSDAPPEANSDIANMIDGAVSASLNNKFVAMSENFESTITSRLDHIEAKFDKQFSGNDINAYTSNTENSKDSRLDDFSNLHIPKVPIGVPPIHHIHSRTTIGALAGGGSTMAATTAMTPHTFVYSEPSAYVPNSSLQHVTNTLPNQTSTYGTPQPTINRASHLASARPRTALGMMGFREEMLDIFRQTFGTEPKTKNRSYQRLYPNNYEYIPYPQGFKIPEFTKFSGDNGRSTLEHIGQFTIQCGAAASNDICKMRLFPLSLSAAAFTWFISLPPNSVYTFLI